MDNKLFVGNLSWDASEDDLTELFGQFGQVEEVAVMRDRFTGRARGFAFVTMGSAEDAQNAINQLTGQEFMGREVRLNVARPREEGAPRGNFGGGAGGGSRRPSGGGGGGGFGGPRGGGGGFRGDRKGAPSRGGFRRRDEDTY